MEVILGHELFGNAKVSLKLATSFAHVPIFLWVVKRSGKICRNRENRDKLDLEHNFDPNIMVVIDTSSNVVRQKEFEIIQTLLLSTRKAHLGCNSD